MSLFGLYRGVVVSSADPLNRGRLLVSIPVLTASSAVYAEPSRAPGAGGALPAVGSGVWVMFEGGQSSNPVWIGVFHGTLGGSSGGDGGGLQTLFDYVSSTLTYVGQSVPGSATDQPVWRIHRVDESNPVTSISYPGNDPGFVWIWDLRASYFDGGVG